MEKNSTKGRLTVRKAIKIAMCTIGKEKIRLKELYPLVNELRGKTPEEQVRSVIYRNSEFIPTNEKGVWSFISANGSEGLLIKSNGREMKEIPNESVDCVIADHPWKLNEYKSGNNKNFTADYEETCFNYNLEDFKNKARVLKNNGVLVEFMPELQGENEHMHFDLLRYAKEVGLSLYTTINYVREGESINTGRKQKGCGVLYIYTKGEAPLIRPNNMKIKQSVYYRLLEENDITTYKDIMNEVLEDGIECFSEEFLNKKLNNKKTSWNIFSSKLAEILKDTANDIVFKSKYCMRGLRYMLPVMYSISKEKKYHQAQKPKELLKKIFHVISLPGSIIVDQFGGSGISFNAISELRGSRRLIIYEILDKYITGDINNKGMVKRFSQL